MQIMRIKLYDWVWAAGLLLFMLTIFVWAVNASSIYYHELKLDFAQNTHCVYEITSNQIIFEDTLCEYNYLEYETFSLQQRCDTFQHCSWLGYKFKK